MSPAPTPTVVHKNCAMHNLMADEQLGREPIRSAGVGSVTSVHTKTRSAHFKPYCDSSFDGNIGFQMIYGNKMDQRGRYFERS